MLRFFLILLVITYLAIIVFRYFLGPFLEGFYGKGRSQKQNNPKEKVKVIYNPNDHQNTNKNTGEYVDYEEVKDK